VLVESDDSTDRELEATALKLVDATAEILSDTDMLRLVKMLVSMLWATLTEVLMASLADTLIDSLRLTDASAETLALIDNEVDIAITRAAEVTTVSELTLKGSPARFINSLPTELFR
jgi:hypothetical protein